MKKKLNQSKIAIFKGKQIRKIIFNNEWWFSIIDIVRALTDSSIPRRYWTDLKRKLHEEGFGQVYEKIVQLKLEAPDGKLRKTDCANTETTLRIIQSIPSPKAEPFKRWLARVGYERIQEIEDPELSMKRMKVVYKLKGYSKNWIEKRVRGIAVRNELTDEWRQRGANENRDYAILTNDIMQGAFGLTVEKYKKLKRLQRQNLRDHMSDIELILTMLGEATTTKLHKDRKSYGVPRLSRDAKDGGAVAGRTRRDIEKQSGKKLISSSNFLPKRQNPDNLIN